MSDLTSLQEIIAEFYDRPPGSCRVEVIHMSSAMERQPLVAELLAALGPGAVVREASLAPPDAPRTCALFIGEAEEAGGLKNDMPLRTPGELGTADADAVYTRRRTPGELGCLLSHVTACRESLAAGVQVLALFEDDCRAVQPLASIRDWLRKVATAATAFSLPPQPEILLLGTMGAYFALPWTPDAKLVERFNGSHALVLTRPFMEKVVGAYEMLLSRNLTAPVDGLYSALLRAEKRWAISPAQDTAFFVQDRSIPSYVVGPDGAPMLR
jgi:hypothetical protein